MPSVSIISPVGATGLLAAAFDAKVAKLKLEHGPASVDVLERRVDGGAALAAQVAKQSGSAAAIDSLDELHTLCMQRRLSGVQRFFSRAPTAATRRADETIDAAVKLLAQARVEIQLADADLDRGSLAAPFKMVQTVISAYAKVRDATDAKTLADASPQQIRALHAALGKLATHALDDLRGDRAAERVHRLKEELTAQPFNGMSGSVIRQEAINFDIARFGLAELCERLGK